VTAAGAGQVPVPSGGTVETAMRLKSWFVFKEKGQAIENRRDGNECRRGKEKKRKREQTRKRKRGRGRRDCIDLDDW